MVRRHVLAALTAAREQARLRRQGVEEADKTYADFLDRVAVPIARQVVNALRAENVAFSVSTPGRGLRVSSDHGRDDYVDVELRTDGDSPQVVGRIHRTRGSRTLDEERAVKTGALPHEITEEDFLAFLLQALQPWLER